MDNMSWIKLYRRTLEGGWLRNHKLWVFWSYCLLKANHKECEFVHGNQKIHLLPGQFIFGRKQASMDLNMSEQSIRTNIDSLRRMKNLTIKSTNKYSIVTICNWSTYQGSENGGLTSKITYKQPATNQQLTTNNNDNNENNENKSIYPRKKKFGEFVFLTDEEYGKLVETDGKEFTDACIERLDNYIGSKGKKYKSHYRTILSWVRDAETEKGGWKEATND